MKIVHNMQKYQVQEKKGKHKGSYRTRYAGKFSAIAQAKQELGPLVLTKKEKNQKKFKRYTKEVLIDMMSDMENQIDLLVLQVYIICVHSMCY